MPTRAEILLVAATLLFGVGIVGGAAAHTLTVIKAGSGSGAVSSAVGDIACGPTCSADIPGSTPVTLTATPDPGSVFTGWLGACTGTGECPFTITGATAVLATFALAATGAPSLDVDATNGCAGPTDAVIAIRYLMGVSGLALSAGAVGADAGRATAGEVASYLEDIRPALDIDGNGQTDALTDGLLIARYMFGARGPGLIAGVVGPGATRATAPEIEAHLAPLHAVCGATAVARIEIAPAGLLLSQFGASGQLTATAFDAQDNPVNVPIVWTSTVPGTVAVNPAGTVQAGMSAGTALITATAGNVRSEPAYVYVATPVAGALLIDDGKIIAGPTAVNPNAPPDPANPYEVVLRGVTAMPIDTIVINTGAKVVGGRVIDVQAQGMDLLVRLVVVPPEQMFSDFAFSDVVDLSKGPFETPPALAAAYDVEQNGSAFVFTPKAGQPAASKVMKATQATFDLPPFDDCEATAGFPNGLPLSLSAPPGFSLQIAGTLVNEITPAGKKIAISAAPVLTITSALEVTSAFEAKVTCKLVLQRKKVRAPGWAGVLFGGDIEFGVGFEVGGKVTLVAAKLGGTATLNTALEAGILCPAGTGSCGLTGSATGSAVLAPVFQAPSLNQFKFEPSVSLFGFVTGEIGNADLQALQFKAIEAKVGATLGASYTLETLQIDNTDPASGRSKYQLDLDGKVAPGQGLGGFLSYAGLNSFVPLELSFQVPLGQSPTGTASADKGLYFVGEPVNLDVRLSPSTVGFLAESLYNVDRVLILRKTGALTTEVLATQTATAGQTTFTFAFNAPVQVSASEMFAFVVPKFLGFDLLPRLEIASAQGAGARITATLPSQVLASADLIVTVETPTGNGQFGPAPNLLVEFAPTCATIDPASDRTDAGGQLSATVTLGAGCDLLSIDITVRADPGTAVLATESVFSVRTRPRIRTVFPGQIYGPAVLDVIVERPIGNADYEAAPDMLVQLAPSCAIVNPLSGRADPTGHLQVTVSPQPGCSAVSIVVTARADANTGLEAQTSVNAAVISGAAPLLGGYDGIQTLRVLGCIDDCPPPVRALARWRLFADNALFLLLREAGGTFSCPPGPTSTCLLKFAINGGQFEVGNSAGTISGSAGGGRLRFVLDQPCVNNGNQATCRTMFDGSRFTLALSPASLAFGTVPVGTTSAPQFVSIRNAGLLPAQIAAATIPDSGYLLNGNTCSTGPVATFFLDADASCSVAIQFKPQSANTLNGTLNVAAQALGPVVEHVPLTGTGN